MPADPQGAPFARHYPGEAPALFCKGVSKVFGTTRVLDDVTLEVMPGEVHGLLGANGSGKSTLIKVIAGLHAPEPGGELILYGKGAPFPVPPGGARRHGISFVHQHLALLPSLTVLENMMLNDLAVETRWRLDWAAERKRIAGIFERFHVDIDPMSRVADLTQADRALIAILRAFDEVETHADGGRGILILDEPTPFLPRSGVEQLFSLVRAIVTDGASVIFVAHDIDEIREITDRATILRDGRKAGTVISSETDHAGFIRLIVGESIELFQTSREEQLPAPVLAQVEGLSAGPATDVDLEIREGEILGLTGLIGSGFDAVPEAIYGARRAEAGTLSTKGTSLPLPSMTPGTAMEAGIAFLPADRLGKGGVGSLSMTDNMSLPVLDRFRNLLGIDWSAIRARCVELGQVFDVRPNRPEQPLAAFSGGNAQKILLAKWMQTKPALLMLDEPTQGIDVGARQMIFAALDGAAHDGMSVLIATTDAEQLAQICHRVLIFSQGRIVSELRGAAITKDAISQETLRAHAPAPDAPKEAAA